MNARITLIDGVAFNGEASSGHSVVMDGAPDPDNPAWSGQNRGARPMELLLLGLGGCTAYDVVTILRKGRHTVDDCQVEIEATRAETPPKVFTRIHIIYRVKGQGLPLKAVERAVKLSEEKYCSASIMLGKTAEMTHEVVLVD
ncbi:MAG: OsmC family protein [Bradymonadia bacterium]